MDYVKSACNDNANPCRDSQMPYSDHAMPCQDNMTPCRRMRDTDSCGCDKYKADDRLSGMPLAMAYVPWQEWKNVYDGATGLKKGSIFGELILPFLYASPVCRECGCKAGRRI